MKLSSAETIVAALDAGVRWLDTARAYGQSESLVARALLGRVDANEVRVVTKCGMRRDGDRWEPDGRAATIRADARASVATLGRAPDVLLLHAPDPAVPIATSVRALLRARDEGLAKAIGLSNVARAELDALDPEDAREIAAIEVALGAFDDAPARGGVVAWCKEHGATLLAHAPFGGPRRAAKLERDQVLREVAAACGASVHEVLLAYLLAIDGCIVPLPGATRPETASSAARAAEVVLDTALLDTLDRRFPGLGMARRPLAIASIAPDAVRAEVVLLMGVAGAGKTRLVERWVKEGYERLNRDLRGGTLRGLAKELERVLAGGAQRVVLDNTYLTRAARSEVLRVAYAASARVRCVHLDTPPHEAQVNVVHRMLERYGELLGGAELAQRAKSDPNLFAPTALFRMQRQLERPSADEGFASIETVEFVRERQREDEVGTSSLAVPIDLLSEHAQHAQHAQHAPGAPAPWAEVLPPGAPVLVFGWESPLREASAARAREVAALLFGSRPIDVALCPHPPGPPVCWCRPPLPGLWIAFARRHRVDPGRSALVVRSPAHRTMARALGLREA